MKQRPRPTQAIIGELTGGNPGLISSLHHGLCEAPLSAFYPYLDFDELVAFAASSWKGRDLDVRSFGTMLSGRGVFDVFEGVYEIGRPWVRKHKRVSPERQELDLRLNPFDGEGLRERLALVDPVHVHDLYEALRNETMKYVFECQYQDEKLAAGGDNSRIKIMGFQNVYPKAGRIVPAFVVEVGRILREFPRKYADMPEALPEIRWSLF
ncbi:MAG: hypothetical protein ABIH92_01760 [Nanoarchaeota archaeon]